MSRPRPPKEIAPRLASGECRDRRSNSLPPEINDALRGIARMENKSVSWVLETVILEFFGFKRPKYIERKKRR